MSDEEINVAIAAHLGWVQEGHNGFQPTWRGLTGERFAQSLLPNYCNDLDAMHEAEKTLDELAVWIGEEHHGTPADAYLHWLACAFKGRACSYADDWEIATATARQRAEAFLRTVGKWKEATA